MEKKLRVFVVDDSDEVRGRLVAMLTEMKNVEVVGQAPDVPEAFMGIQTLKPKVVILDIRMPSGTGITVLQGVKQAKPAPVVIMLTNYPYLQYRKKCLQAGADFFFDKSTEFNRIPQVVELLLQDFRD